VSNDGGTPAQLTAFIKAETLRVKSVLGPAGVAPDTTAKAP
jgi:hypothetical protein